MLSFSFGARPLTCKIAKTSELNSWPNGIPAKVMPVSSLGRLTEKLGVRFKSFQRLLYALTCLKSHLRDLLILWIYRRNQCSLQIEHRLPLSQEVETIVVLNLC